MTMRGSSRNVSMLRRASLSVTTGFGAPLSPRTVVLMYNGSMDGIRLSTNAYTVSRETLEGRDFYLCLGDFLDAFYRVDIIEREALLVTPPDFSLPDVELAYLASAVHKLSNTFGYKPPKWVFDERCYLRERPFFGCEAKGKLRMLFMYKSPAEFKHRNLFVDENVLARV